MRRKLIEVALPLEKINAESAREKSIRHGHPSTLHLWWARRPLAACRAVLFAQLVDDPSSHPEEFPTEELRKKERERLHAILEDLVVWENTRKPEVIEAARAEIMRSTGGNPPPILDPFCGGGSIPLEAQRLGLEAHASDLNPVAVLITKALIEIPPKFAGQKPVFPGLADGQIRTWAGAEGLAADVRAYGEWMRDRAYERIGHLYPKATLPDGSKATVIAWIWARTVTCPNPACRIEMPLVRSWWLGKKKGKEAYVVPSVVGEPTHPSGLRVQYAIGHGSAGSPTPETDGTVGRTGAVCVNCEAPVDLKYVRAEGRGKRMGARLMAVVAEGKRTRIYLPPTEEHVRAADVRRPENVPEGELPQNPRDFKTPNYGMTAWADLFTPRQLTALTTFSDLVTEAREQVLADGGTPAYADALATLLGLAVGRFADYSSSISTWMPDPKNEGLRNTFARQALPMTWDFGEANAFSDSSGNVGFMLRGVGRVLDALGSASANGQVSQSDALRRLGPGTLISTDPPYYDNIGYSDLSDFFYVWLRRALRDVHPDLLGTLLVPKAEELVANPYRHGSKDKAQEFFELGFGRVFARARETALEDFPITVYYAFKQSEVTRQGFVSTGWETLLEGMIRSRWAVTATWPMRSERTGRMLSVGTNALASSIVLALRPRPDDAPRIDRRGFLAALEAELPDALRELQQGRIAPVDLPQAAIGPGMAVFSRYAQVLQPDGTPMRVRDALAQINATLDRVLEEQEGDFDQVTRFALVWFRQHGYRPGRYGEAESLATARTTAVKTVERTGILTSTAGKVALIRPADLPVDYEPSTDERISIWEVVHHLVRVQQAEGIAAAGGLLKQVDERVDPDLAKELAFLLYRIANDRKMSKEALAFNEVATAWTDIVAASRAEDPTHVQPALDYSDE